MKEYCIMFQADAVNGMTVDPKLVTAVTYTAESPEDALRQYCIDAREWCPDYVPDDRIYAHEMG